MASQEVRHERWPDRGVVVLTSWAKHIINNKPDRGTDIGEKTTNNNETGWQD